MAIKPAQASKLTASASQPSKPLKIGDICCQSENLFKPVAIR
jgi:hypothetical protein